MRYISFSPIRYLFSLGILMALFLGSTFAHAVWQQEWERVLKAAKQEGKVAVLGPTGTHRGDALTLPFQKKFGIRVEYRGERGSGAQKLVRGQSGHAAQRRVDQDVDAVPVQDRNAVMHGVDQSLDRHLVGDGVGLSSDDRTLLTS